MTINKTHIDLNLAKNEPRIKRVHIVKSSDSYVYLINCKQNLLLYKNYAIIKRKQCFKSAQSPAPSQILPINTSFNMFVLIKVIGKKSWKPHIARMSASD